MPHSTDNAGSSPAAPRYAPDEQQPEANIDERNALTEREDGTIRAGKLPQDFPGGAPPDAVPLIALTADEAQPINEMAEYRSLSEREDGTNRG